MPLEIAVMGFAHLPSNARPARQPTTVDASWSEVARRAVETLVARCNGEKVPDCLELPVRLVQGDTT